MGTKWAHKSQKGSRICIICLDMAPVKDMLPPYIAESIIPLSSSNDSSETRIPFFNGIRVSFFLDGQLWDYCFSGLIIFIIQIPQICHPCSSQKIIRVLADYTSFFSCSPYRSPCRYPCSAMANIHSHDQRLLLSYQTSSLSIHVASFPVLL